MARSATESDLIAAVRSLLASASDPYSGSTMSETSTNTTYTIDLEAILSRADLRVFVKSLVADTLDRSNLFERSADSSYRIRGLPIEMQQSLPDPSPHVTQSPRQKAPNWRGRNAAATPNYLQDHHLKGLKILRTAREDKLVTRYWADSSSKFPACLAAASSSEALTLCAPSTGELEQLWLTLSPFRSPLIAGILGGASQAPAWPGASVLLVPSDDINSLFSLLYIANIVGPEGKVYLQPERMQSQMSQLNEVVDACPGNIKFFSESDELPLDCDALIAERTPCEDPIALLVAPNKHRLGSGAVVTVLMGSDTHPEQLYPQQVVKMRELVMKPLEQLTLEPFINNVAVLVGKNEPLKSV